MSRDVDTIVDNVSKQLNSTDKKAEAQAYQLLSDEIRNVSTTQGEQAASELGSAVLHRLEADGQLPRLCVGWVRSNYDQINNYKEDYGISVDEVARYTHKAGTPQAMLNSVMADALLKQDADGDSVFGDVANRSWNGLRSDLIEKADLRAFARQERRHERREASHEQVLRDAERLLAGEPPLMAVLDASADGKADGRVSEHDMRKFLVNYSVNEQTANRGQYPYTEDNKQFVQELLNGNYPHITGDNFTGFSAEALARRAGLDHFIVHNAEDYQVLKQMFDEKLHPAAEEEPEINVTTDPENEPENASENEAPKPPKDRTNPVKDAHEAIKETFESIDDMCTFQPGEGHWHIAKRLLNAGFPAEDRASNKEIWELTQALMALSGHTLDEYGRPSPMVHPGDKVADFSCMVEEWAQTMPRLAQSLDNFKKEHERTAE